jgi:hypothetical protein
VLLPDEDLKFYAFFAVGYISKLLLFMLFCFYQTSTSGWGVLTATEHPSLYHIRTKEQLLVVL